MAEIKLSKNELRAQQSKLAQLNTYLPTLQLKKSMLQAEVQEARIEIIKCEDHFEHLRSNAVAYCALLTDNISVDILQLAKIVKVNKHFENIAGIEVPYLESVIFEDFPYSLIDTPVWVDVVIKELRELVEAKVRITIAKDKLQALENELRQVSIRVNLFEKNLIPSTKCNIKKIKVFLGEQQLAAVSRAKVSKRKIEAQKKTFILRDPDSSLVGEKYAI